MEIYEGFKIHGFIPSSLPQELGQISNRYMSSIPSKGEALYVINMIVTLE